MSGPALWLDPNWRRMDELFAPEDEAALRAAYDVRWGRDEKAPDAALKEVLPEIAALVSCVPEVDRALLAAAPKLRTIVEVSGSFPGSIDYEACAEAGVEVLSCAPGFRDAVAEMAVGMLIAAGRGIVEEHERFRRGEERWLSDNSGQDYRLYGATIGFVGFGQIAQEITRLIAPLGARVLAHDPFLPEAAAAEHGVTLVSLDEVMSAPRAVFIAAAPTHENRGLIGAAQIARMRPGAQLLVISRAHLVDFDALTEAVLAGRIRAAIDVFPSEPLSADHPIRSAAGVILSPHRAAAVDGGRHLIGRMLLDDLAAIREGRPERRLQVATPEKVRLTAGVGDAEQVGAMAEER